jgi:hypothetical protein
MQSMRKKEKKNLPLLSFYVVFVLLFLYFSCFQGRRLPGSGLSVLN